jgi:HTH-type transcriptional regulator / antitoxin HipB
MKSSEIGETIRLCRKRSGLTQLELAKMAGVGKTVVFDIENGKETVQMNSLLKILEILNIRLELLTPFEK